MHCFYRLAMFLLEQRQALLFLIFIIHAFDPAGPPSWDGGGD
jgi:hypothetical protein